MLNSLPSKRSSNIELERREIEVALSRSETPSLVLIYPPADELRRIRDNYVPKVSLRDTLKQDPFDLRSRYRNELERLLRKEASLRDSATFLNHIANLYALTNERGRSRDYMLRASQIGDAAFFASELARSYVIDGNLAAASDAFARIDMVNSVEAHLINGQIALMRNDVPTAARFIKLALSLDAINVDANIAQGGLKLLSGEPAHAIRHFRVAIDEGHVSSNVHVNLALCHYLLGDSLHAARDLQRAVSINPTNENALVFFADLSFEISKADDAIPALRKYLTFEENSEAAWNRLARGYFVTERYRDALEALHHEANLTTKPAVWNNIAVVYDRMGETRKAEGYFNLALTLAQKDEAEHAASMVPVLRNLAAHHIANKKSERALTLTTSALELGNARKLNIDAVLPTHIDALINTGKIAEAKALARDVLASETVVSTVRFSILTSMCAALADTDSKEEILQLCSQLQAMSDNDGDLPEPLVLRGLNNAMFAYLQIGEVAAAEAVAKRMAHHVHRDPFVTATFGLLALKRHRLERGIGLYKEAIGIARDRTLKDQIRQRQNFELGRIYLAHRELKDARNSLDRAVNEKLGTDVVRRRAKALLASIK
jgi:tetratricopeptide (TPR) repeat protein